MNPYILTSPEGYKYPVEKIYKHDDKRYALITFNGSELCIELTEGWKVSVRMGVIV